MITDFLRKVNGGANPFIEAVKGTHQAIGEMTPFKQIREAQPKTQEEALKMGMIKVGNATIDPNFVGSLSKTGAKMVGGYLRGNSPIIQALKTKISKALTGNRLHPNSEALMDIVLKLDEELIPASLFDEANKLLKKLR
jgi:hypothetical protein